MTTGLRASTFEFQSTLPARGATAWGIIAIDNTFISIHAPRTGSDLPSGEDGRCQVYFNPRSPHGERRNMAVRAYPEKIFQSTLPARGATYVIQHSNAGDVYFNPRSPHGERHAQTNDYYATDPFQSTLPARGATPIRFINSTDEIISIHAPRTGSDPTTGCLMRTTSRFQSTLPARGATKPWLKGMFAIPFQSTLPARGATQKKQQVDDGKIFQSTLPARGATKPWLKGMFAIPFQSTLPARGATQKKQQVDDGKIFQSTLPARGATEQESGEAVKATISIHAPRTGSDGLCADCHQKRTISIHAPRTGSDDAADFVRQASQGFQSTLPARGATKAPPCAVCI